LHQTLQKDIKNGIKGGGKGDGTRREVWDRRQRGGGGGATSKSEGLTTTCGAVRNWNAKISLTKNGGEASSSIKRGGGKVVTQKDPILRELEGWEEKE